MQAIIFDKNKYTKRQADQWLKKHNKHPISSRVTKNFYRYRMFEPVKGRKYRLKTITDGIKIVLSLNFLEKSSQKVYKKRTF